MTDVSVVIPTRGRESLSIAVESAYRQQGVGVEVIVVDASGTGAARPLLRDLSEAVYVDATRPLGAADARWAGCGRSQGEWIAFLDDDDVFAPTKSLGQIERAGHEGAALVTCDYSVVPYCQIRRLGDTRTDEWDGAVASLLHLGRKGPLERPHALAGVAPYLFERRSLKSRKRLVTSSVIAKGEIARSVPWNSGLSRFEDWDWYLAIDSIGGVWAHHPELLVAIGDSAPGSLSDRGTRLSPALLSWPIGPLAGKAPRALGDVLVCDVGVTLAKGGDISGAVGALRAGMIVGKPGAYAIARWVAAMTTVTVRIFGRKVARSLRRIT